MNDVRFSGKIVCIFLTGFDCNELGLRVKSSDYSKITARASTEINCYLKIT